MKYLFILVVALLAIIFIAPRYTAQAERPPVYATSTVAYYTVVYPEKPKLPHKSAIKALVFEKAALYGANGEQMWITISTCENKALDPKLQSYHPSKSGPNGREDSWGLAQIHLPSHPMITREQAQDPEFAITFMAKEFAAGRATKWTCWRTIFGKPLYPSLPTATL